MNKYIFLANLFKLDPNKTHKVSLIKFLNDNHSDRKNTNFSKFDINIVQNFQDYVKTSETVECSMKNSDTNLDSKLYESSDQNNLLKNINNIIDFSNIGSKNSLLNDENKIQIKFIVHRDEWKKKKRIN